MLKKSVAEKKKKANVKAYAQRKQLLAVERDQLARHIQLRPIVSQRRELIRLPHVQSLLLELLAVQQWVCYVNEPVVHESVSGLELRLQIVARPRLQRAQREVLDVSIGDRVAYNEKHHIVV